MTLHQHIIFKAMIETSQYLRFKEFARKEGYDAETLLRMIAEQDEIFITLYELWPDKKETGK